MMKIDRYKVRINELLKVADNAIEAFESIAEEDAALCTEYMDELWTGGASFLSKVFGENHVIYKSFASSFNSKHGQPRAAKGALKSAKAEIDGGWLFDLRGIVSAEIFNDFFEMASHLLSEGYKDPAAVMIGSTLEEHLRHLCTNHNIPLVSTNPSKPSVQIPKKADVMNADLVKAQVYNVLDQKQVTAWLGLRNSAAHGKYTDYTKEQVEAMQYGVMNFITRIA